MALNEQQMQALKSALEKKKQQMGEEAYTEYMGVSAAKREEAAQKTAEQAAAQQKPLLIQAYTGAQKGAAHTALNVGALGRGFQSMLSKGVDKVFGTEGFGMGGESYFDKGGEKYQQIAEKLEPDTTAEKIGYYGEQAAEFMIPSMYAGKATTGMNITTRMLGQGVSGAATQAAQSGDIGKDELIVGATNALMVPVADLLTKGLTSLSTHFPEWLVKPLIKQTPSEKLRGKDAAQILVDQGYIGTVDELVQQTDDAMTSLNTQIDDVIASHSANGSTVHLDDIVGQLADDFNAAGGKTSGDEILDIINKLAPQARGLLEKDTLTLTEANQLRMLLDRTLGDRAFVASQLTYNKGVLMDFTNALRSSVQSTDEVLAPLYQEFSKNITLKQALQARQVAGGGFNSIGMYDLLTGGAAMGVTGGDPVTTLLAVGARRAFESAPVKTTLAQVFKNSDKVTSALMGMSPAIQAAVLELVSNVTDDTANTQDNPEQQPTQGKQ